MIAEIFLIKCTIITWVRDSWLGHWHILQYRI